MSKASKGKGAVNRSGLIDPFRVTRGEDFHLKRFSPGETLDLDKDRAKDILKGNLDRLRDLQERLYAQDRWSLLLIFQGMDAAGKDSAIENVMASVNPQGCDVHSFKVPTSKELDHDFMWRSTVALPERGRIGIFNRSYYEELIVVRVHPEILAKQKLPPRLVSKNIWRERFEDITAFERYLARQGTVILKFFLNVSKEEQRQRFLERLEEPSKWWKFSMGDVGERALWDKYQAAWQDTIKHTSSDVAPWHVVPADRKWMTRAVISSAIVDALEKMDPKFPAVDKKASPEYARVRQALIDEGPKDVAVKSKVSAKAAKKVRVKGAAAKT